jgi:phage terminase large subunit GpA-like protein
MEASMRASITCPSTGEVVAFSVETDAATVTKSWKQFIRMQCPHCNERHAIAYKDVYLDGVLANLMASNPTMFTMLPEVPKPGAKQQRV